MVNILGKRADIMAIQNDLAFQLVPVLLDVIMFNHDDHHVNLVEELVKIKNLVGNDFLVGEEGVEALQRAGEVALLDVKHLEGRALCLKEGFCIFSSRAWLSSHNL